MEQFVLLVINVILIYFVVGLLFGIYFFFKGAAQIDPLILESKWTVRLLLVPGAIATWPFLIPKLLKTKSSKT